MAYTTINKSTDHFDTKVYTGNGSSQTLDMDNVGLLWMKNRTEDASYRLFDSVRGGYYNSSDSPSSKLLSTDNANSAYGSDVTLAYGINFGSSSSTIGSDGGGYNYNQNGKSYVAWQWGANGAGSANTDGDVTSTVSVNTTSGFSIVKWDSTGTAGINIGHGLGQKPAMIIAKCLNQSSTSWAVYHQSLGATKYYSLQSSTAATTSATRWNNSEPTTTTFQTGSSGDIGGSNRTMIAYCFAEKTGYSKFGTYKGNSANDGTFIYTGFSVGFIMVKRKNSTGNWILHDLKRSSSGGDNQNQYILHANTNSSRMTDESAVDLYSNGFKWRNAYTDQNANGSSYIFMAFAEAPLVGTNNIAANAK